MAAESWDELETFVPAVIDFEATRVSLEGRARPGWAGPSRAWQRSCGPNVWRAHNSCRWAPAVCSLWNACRRTFKWRSAGGNESEGWRRSMQKTKKMQSQAWRETWAGMFWAPPLHYSYIRLNWISRLAISDVPISMFTFCASFKTLTPRCALRYWVSQPVCTRVTYFEWFIIISFW